MVHSYFIHISNVLHSYFIYIFMVHSWFIHGSFMVHSWFIHISFIFHSYFHGSFIFHSYLFLSSSIQETLVNFNNWALKCSRSGSRSRACTGADLRALLAGVSWRKNPGVWCFSTGLVAHFRFLRHETRAESVLKTADHVIVITTSWWFKKVRNPNGSRSSSGPTTEALLLLFWPQKLLGGSNKC